LCDACDAGYYLNAEGSFSADDCQECDVGQYAESEGTQLCDLCVEGRYRNSKGAHLESQCLECETGTYTIEPGTEECTDCVPGHFSVTPLATSADVCLQCPHGRYESEHASTQCGACPVGFFPSDDQTECHAHNTQAHICVAERFCEALPQYQDAAVPHPEDPAYPAATFFWEDKDSINNMDDWCNYQCLDAPDRLEKAFCPRRSMNDETGLIEEDAPTADTRCTCHEKRSDTRTLQLGDSFEDKECAGHQQCSHSRCEIVEHLCDAHKNFTAWAEHRGQMLLSQDYKPDYANCDNDDVQKTSIKVSHYGRDESMCNHGHHCYMTSETDCVCVQQKASRPDSDRCWYDVHTETSKRACYRECKESERAGNTDQDACDAAGDFEDITPPVLHMCGGLMTTVTSRHWNLCQDTAEDIIDGDVTDLITYTVIRLADGQEETICSDCTQGEAASRFHMYYSGNNEAQLVNGDYIVVLSVCDRQGNCVAVENSEKDIKIELPTCDCPTDSVAAPVTCHDGTYEETFTNICLAECAEYDTDSCVAASE